MKCSISNGGLFIPLDNHREIFCTSPHFRECQQYTLVSENQKTSSKIVRKTEVNRRKYLRFTTFHQITLLKILKSGNPISRLPHELNTLDVSKGGMRITTDRPIKDTTMIQFSFDDSFPETLRDMTGQVAWCNKQVDARGYQAGIFFTKAALMEEMGRFLEQKRGRL